MKFCFPTYASILVKCTTPRVSQCLLVSRLISAVDHTHGDELRHDSTLASNYVRGTKNLSPRVEVFTEECNPQNVLDYFVANILPLLDQNKKRCMVGAIKDVISKDVSIESDTTIEYVSRLNKSELLAEQGVDLGSFLAGLFLYVVTNTKNTDGRGDVKLINDEYIDSFRNIEIINYYKVEDEGNSLSHSTLRERLIGEIGEQTAEKARLFCIDHEKDLHLLPLCEMAAILNPKHQHINKTINDYIRCDKKTRDAILLSESIKPYKQCSEEEIEKCLVAFEKVVHEKKLSTLPFLYDGGKYFHRAFIRYSDFEIPDIDPWIFKRKYVSSILEPEMRGDLGYYLSDYFYGLKYYPDDDNEPPFNMLWYGLNLANCDERILVFWVNRFIITVCHFFHCFRNLNMEEDNDERLIYKDTINEEELRTMEEMYYYAILLLYMSFGSKQEETRNLGETTEQKTNNS